MTSNADFEEYGESSWIDKYVEDLRDGMRNGTRTIDEVYQEFAETLRQNKERILAEQKWQAEGQRDADQFDDFLRNMAGGDYDKYNE
jgi:hypothetical protein